MSIPGARHAKRTTHPSPQWMRSTDSVVWHEIAPDTHRLGLCGEVVRGAVHQRRHVPVDGVLCPGCVAWRGVVEVVPREPNRVVARQESDARGNNSSRWPDAEPDVDTVPNAHAPPP